MGHPVERYPGMSGSADCPRENCPSKDHDVWFEKNEKGEITATIFECRVCGATERWGDPELTMPLDPVTKGE